MRPTAPRLPQRRYRCSVQRKPASGVLAFLLGFASGAVFVLERMGLVHTYRALVLVLMGTAIALSLVLWKVLRNARATHATWVGGALGLVLGIAGTAVLLSWPTTVRYQRVEAPGLALDLAAGEVEYDEPARHQKTVAELDPGRDHAHETR